MQDVEPCEPSTCMIYFLKCNFLTQYCFYSLEPGDCYDNVHTIIGSVFFQLLLSVASTSSVFSSNSEAFASELLENIKEMFHLYQMCSGITSRFEISNQTIESYIHQEVCFIFFKWWLVSMSLYFLRILILIQKLMFQYEIKCVFIIVVFIILVVYIVLNRSKWNLILVIYNLCYVDMCFNPFTSDKNKIWCSWRLESTTNTKMDVVLSNSFQRFIKVRNKCFKISKKSPRNVSWVLSVSDPE